MIYIIMLLMVGTFGQYMPSNNSCNSTDFLYNMTTSISYCLTCQKGCTNCCDPYICNNCGTGYRLNSTTATCIRCPVYCNTCTPNGLSSTCTNCMVGYALQSDGTCTTCGTNCNTCTQANYCDSCASGFYSAKGKCTACTYGCDTCQVTAVSVQSCMTCIDQYYLIGDQCQHCPVGCQLCRDDVTCTACIQSYYLVGSTCTQCAQNCNNCAYHQCMACNLGYVLNYTSNTCIGCPDINCNACNLQNTSLCTTCISGYYNLNNKCIQCNVNCTVCSQANTCTSCVSGYYLSSNACVVNTILNCKAQASMRVCGTCNDGYFLNNSTCSQCTSNCLSCSAAFQCDQCSTGYFFNGYQCQSCPTGCESCNDQTSCKRCTYGRIMRSMRWKCLQLYPKKLGLSELRFRDFHSYCSLIIMNSLFLQSIKNSSEFLEQSSHRPLKPPNQFMQLFYQQSYEEQILEEAQYPLQHFLSSRQPSLDKFIQKEIKIKPKQRSAAQRDYRKNICRNILRHAIKELIDEDSVTFLNQFADHDFIVYMQRFYQQSLEAISGFRVFKDHLVPEQQDSADVLKRKRIFTQYMIWFLRTKATKYILQSEANNPGDASLLRAIARQMALQQAALEKNQIYMSNYDKLTIGKVLRKAKRLRKEDPEGVIPETPKQLQQYIEYLTGQGLQINKVKFAYFKTKNGLPYPGLMATDRILSEETIVTVPMPMLLTTRHAYESPLKKMFQDFPQFFSEEFQSAWEDHMFIAFLLYEYQRGIESPWHHLIANLPKEIDYVVFWDPEDIKRLKDRALEKQVRKYKKEYQTEYETFRQIAVNYPEFYQLETISEPNFRWIYIHMVTRCFGKYLNFVTMVPFCELFNHECVDVYYDFEFNKDSPHKSEESEFKPPTFLSREEEDDCTSSEGSYNSEDEISDDEYLPIGEAQEEFPFEQVQQQEKEQFYDQFKQSFDITRNQEESEVLYEERIKQLQDHQIKLRKDFNIKQNLQKEIYLFSKDIKNWIFANLNYGDNYSIFFIGQIYAKIDKTLKEYTTGQKAYFMAREDLKRVQLTCSSYKNNLYAFHKDVLKKSISSATKFGQKSKPEEDKFKTPQEILSQQVDQELNYYDKQWKEDKFDRFVMRCSRKDQFEKGSQVYFCYGRLSNRMMLMRYGMALEYNKYDHYHLRVPYEEFLKPEAKSLAHQYQLSKYKRFKLKYTQFANDLIVFCKATQWTFNVHSLDTLFQIQDLQFELAALQMAFTLLELEYAKENTVEDLENQLYDKKLDYHQYFAIVYRLEKQRIIRHNITLIRICVITIDRMKQGMDFQMAQNIVTDFESEQDRVANRNVLRRYFDQMRYALYIVK